MERPKYTLKEASAAISVREPDKILSTLAAAGGFNVLLIVGGQLYSGSVVKFEEWLEASRKIGLPEPVVQAIKDFNDEPEYFSEDTPPLENDERPEHEIAEEQIKSIRRYLYLLNVRQKSANGMDRLHGAAMRFRLSEIQGWAFGSPTE